MKNFPTTELLRRNIQKIRNNYSSRFSFQNVTSPLTIWKSSMSALVPREAADFLARSEKAREFVAFLKNVRLPDEKLWATLTGNPIGKPSLYTTTLAKIQRKISGFVLILACFL
jgi:hypothetical protein